MKLKTLMAGLAISLITTSAAFGAEAQLNGIIDDDVAGWVWSGMREVDDANLYGGTAHAGGPETYGEYTFDGTGVDVISGSGPTVTIDGHVHRAGRARISIDGKVIGLSTPSRPGDNLAHIVGLKNEIHVVQIEAMGGWIAVDYIVVLGNGDSSPNAGTPSTALSVAGPAAREGRYQFEDCDYFAGGIPRPGMPGFYRPGNISVEPASDIDGGYDVGNLRVGEWFEWERVPVRGRKHLLIRAACWDKNAHLNFVIDGVPQPTITLPITGGFQNYTTVDAGWFDFGNSPVHTIRIVSQSQDAMNLNWWQLSPQ